MDTLQDVARTQFQLRQSVTRDVPRFESGLEHDVHIRTEIRREFPFALDWFSKSRVRSILVNGVLNADLPNEFSVRPLAHAATDKAAFV
jgi:hypothetical protein